MSYRDGEDSFLVLSRVLVTCCGSLCRHNWIRTGPNWTVVRHGWDKLDRTLGGVSKSEVAAVRSPKLHHVGSLFIGSDVGDTYRG